MLTTTCPVCKGVGHTTKNGCPTVCSDCLGVGEITVRPYVHPPLPLAKFAGSLTGKHPSGCSSASAGGTVTKAPADQPPKKP